MRFASVLMAAATRGGISYDTDAVSWRDAVVSNGGTVSAGRLALVSALVVGLKAGGSWALQDDYWLLCAENATQALTSLKQRRLATVVSAPTFAADTGYAFNGTSNYINTGFVASTHAVNLTGTNQRLSVYERVNVNSSGTSIGVSSSGTVNLRIVARSGTNAICSLNSGTGNFAVASDGRGYTAVSRAGGATTMSAYKNGVALTDVTGLTVGTTLVAIALYIGARNNAGTADTFRATTIGFAGIGAPLSAAQELAEYNAVQAYMTAIGANV